MENESSLGHLHPSVLLGVAALAVIYLIGIRITHAKLSRRCALCFAAALAMILLALNGPVDGLADDRLFTAHMLQHLMLSLVMPPLLLLGIPEELLRPILPHRWIRPIARGLTNPLVAFALYNGVLVWIHNPPIFEWMCRDEDFHVAVHILLMITGTVMWWPLLSPLPELPRLSYPAQMLYLFFLLIPMAAVSAPITLSSEVIYPWYLEGPHPLGVEPLADQVAGGLLMWVGAGCYIILVFTLIFAVWCRHEDRDTPMVGIHLQPR